MKRVFIAKHLTDREHNLFMTVHAQHIATMGIKERIVYGLSNISKVERGKQGKGLNVYFRSGDWWHYTNAGDWF